MDDLGFCGPVHHIFGQVRSVGDAGAEGGGVDTLLGGNNAHNLQGLAALYKRFHVGFIPGHILPDGVLFVVAVLGGGGNQLEFQGQQFVVGPLHGGGVQLLRGLAGHDLAHHLFQFGAVPQAQGVGDVVADPVGTLQNQDHFAVILGPPAPDHIVLGIQHLGVVHHLVENVGVHIGGKGGASGQIPKETGGVDLHDPVRCVGGEDQGLDAVGILDGVQGMGHLVIVFDQMGLEGFQVIFAHAAKHLGDGLLFHHRVAGFQLFRLLGCGTNGGIDSGYVRFFLGDGQGIVGQGIFLDLVDVELKAGTQGHDQGDADDADGACKGGQEGPGLLGPQVVEAQAQGSPEPHGGPAHVFVVGSGLGLGLIGVGVAGDPAILDPDDPGGVFLRQLRVVGDHDHQTVPGHFFQQIHDLDTGLGVQSAGGFVRQQDIRVVDQGPGDCHTLHLSAGHLVGLFVDLVAQTHRFQGLLGPTLALAGGDAGDGQGQLHVGKNGLVGDQVVALEHKADGVVSVGIPVPVGVLLGGNAVDDQVAAVIPVQTADDVQQGGLAGTAGA